MKGKMIHGCINVGLVYDEPDDLELAPVQTFSCFVQ